MTHPVFCTTSTILLATFLVTAAGCPSTATDESGGIVIYDASPGGAPDGGIRPNRPVMTGEISPVYGFVSPEARVEYYYMGEVDRRGDQVPANAIYLFFDEGGRPLFRLASDGSRVVGWHPVVDVIPTKEGYSPFWRVHQVKVKGSVNEQALKALQELPTTAGTCQMDAVCPGGKKCIEERCTDPITIGDYDLDAIKSLSTLEESGLTITATDTVINCPVVDANAKLLKGLSNPDVPFPRVQLWYKRLKAFCWLMEGGKKIMGEGAGDLPAQGKAPSVADAYFIRRDLTFNTATSTPVLPKRNLVITEHLPGSAGYSPLVQESTIWVEDTEHEFKDLRSLQEARDLGLTIEKTAVLHNLVVRGTIPACAEDSDCADTGGKVDPPLKCSIDQGYCSPPFAMLYEECRSGVKECDPKGGPNGTPLICVHLGTRDKYFCSNTCDGNATDENPDKEIDSRCGSKLGMFCYPLSTRDPSLPNGVCVQRCNSRAGSKENLLQQCVADTCGDGNLDYGETCDDGNRNNGDGCNEFCTLSTFSRCESNADCKGEGQSCASPGSNKNATYCLPVDKKEKDEREDKDKYRVICMEADYCWPPDDRADWLGKEEEEK